MNDPQPARFDHSVGGVKRFIARVGEWIAPAVAIVLSILPLLRGGFAMGHDWPFELVRIAEFRFALLDGQLPPFWASNLYGGLGSPIFLFYPPLYLTLSAALVPLTTSVANAAVATLVVFTLMGAGLVWKLMRQVCPAEPAGARIAVVLYSLQPYLLADKWVRNANAEFAALSILPAVLIGATAREPRRAFWWTTISLTAVILAHNVIALVAAALAFMVAALVHRNARALAPVGLGGLTALGLTAFFWLPAFVLLPLVQHNDLLIGKFDFHGQFPDLRAVFSTAEFYSGGWLVLPLLVAMILSPVKDNHARKVVRVFALMAVGLILMMTRFSTIAWEKLPLLPYAQFPWRLTGPLAVLLAAGGGIAANALKRPLIRRTAEAGVLVFAIVNAYPAMQRYVPLSPQIKTQAERVLTRDGIRAQKLRATVYDEYRPVTNVRQSATGTERKIVFAKWAFPVWSARVNGRGISVETCRDGLACVDATDANEQVALQLDEPRVRQRCKALSAFCGVGLLVWALFVRPRSAARAARKLLQTAE